MVPSVRVFMALRCERVIDQASEGWWGWVGAGRERGGREACQRQKRVRTFFWRAYRSPWNEVTKALDFVHKPILKGAVGVRDGDARHRGVVDFG